MVKYEDAENDAKEARVSPKPPRWWFILCFGLAAFGFYGCVKLIFPSKEAQINQWFAETAYYQCESDLKEKLKDPESYKRIGDFSSGEELGVAQTNTSKTITWDFRAKNSFGGYNVGSAACNITKDNGGTTKAYILAD
jgi:hypothetical protein